MTNINAQEMVKAVIIQSDCLSLSLNEASFIPRKYSVHAYPNPFNSIINIDIQGENKVLRDGLLTIRNIRGQVVRVLTPQIIKCI
ncbi:hypothetical protein JW877_10145 [bacterium]|nr:hypothetical protein [bacterium]